MKKQNKGLKQIHKKSKDNQKSISGTDNNNNNIVDRGKKFDHKNIKKLTLNLKKIIKKTKLNEKLEKKDQNFVI